MAFQFRQIMSQGFFVAYIGKLTIKRILSFSLTLRATAHNKDNILTLAILK